MAIKKIEIRPKGDGTYSDVLYPKTSADMVINETTGKTIQEELVSHQADTTKHVTQAEKDAWNNANKKIGDLTKLNTKAKTNLVDAINGLFTDVSNGKIRVRNTITDKGGTVADADGDGIPTFDELVNAINSLQTFQNGFTTPSKSSIDYYAQDKNGVIYSFDYEDSSNKKLVKLNSNGVLLASYNIGYASALFYSEDGYVKEVGDKFRLYTEQNVLIKELFSTSVLTNNDYYQFIGYRNDGYIVAKYQAGTSGSYIRVYNEKGVKLTETSWTGGSLASYVSNAFLNKNRTLVLVCSDGYGEIDEIWRIPKGTYSIRRYSFDIPDIFYNDFTTI